MLYELDAFFELVARSWCVLSMVTLVCLIGAWVVIAVKGLIATGASEELPECNAELSFMVLVAILFIIASIICFAKGGPDLLIPR